MMRQRDGTVLRVVLAVGIASWLTGGYIGCAGKRHALVVADVAVYEVLNDIHSAEQTALCGQPSCATVCTMDVEPPVCSVPAPVAQWNAVKSKAFNVKFLPGVVAGQQFNNVLEAWNPDEPMPEEVAGLIQSLGASLAEVTSAFPAGSTKETILANIGKAQQLVLNTIALVLSVVGGN